MGMAQMVVTAVLVEGRSTAEVARDYKISHPGRRDHGRHRPPTRTGTRSSAAAGRRWVITLVQRFPSRSQTCCQSASRICPMAARARARPGRKPAE
jgi:hypothetical protein